MEAHNRITLVFIRWIKTTPGTVLYWNTILEGEVVSCQRF